ATRLYTAVRAALGASRQRLIRQVLTESVLLAVLGGLAGLYVAFAGTRTILWLAFRGAQYLPIDASPSCLVLGFAFLLSLLPRLAQIPGVLSASLSGYSPLGGNNWNERVYIEGHPPDFEGPAPSWDRVGPHYFETIGTRLLRGRAIEERDTPAAQHVAVINETFARKVFHNEDPIGQHLGLGDASHSGDYEVVGVVEDAKYQDTRGPAYATVFLPLLQTPAGAPSH